MKTQFDIKKWLGEKRETIIAKYNDLTKEQHFNGITLREFMVDILEGMERNNVKSDNRAAMLLPHVMGSIYFNNSTVTGNDTITEKLRAKYSGTEYMAMV